MKLTVDITPRYVIYEHPYSEIPVITHLIKFIYKYTPE